ncbi:MAG: electron transport complex subunit RsxC [Bacterioplanes sp.]|nr:electron transport complex subunit RsxC [Bacterioplanes sp.]
MTQMIRLHDIHGGIHPAENKRQSTQTAIQVAPIPNELILPLHQHIGAAAIPCVNVGERVLKGQCIAHADGFVSVPLHAPTSGTIVDIEARPVPHASGLSETCMVLQCDGQDEWQAHPSLLEQKNVSLVEQLKPADILTFLAQSGIAGLGGAGFPTAIKLHTGNYPIDTLILNGAECEPYITADDMLMRERADEVVAGGEILLHVLQCARALIGVEDNKPEAIAALEQAVIDAHLSHKIQVVSIPTKYPSGGEKQLIQILTGKEVPSGGIPAHIGIVCQNVATASAIYRAVVHGEPLIHRITTLTGDACQQPSNWQVLLGTPIDYLLTLAGYQAQQPERVIMGGPMMGFALPHLQLPVIKTSNCILAPKAKELPLNEYATACIRCGQCTQVCPAELLPQQLYWFSKTQELDKVEQHNVFDCIECGACSYVCPSHIPLVQYYRFAKGAIREERAAQEKALRAKERFEQRLARQEQELAEKEAKRKARAEAAATAQKAKQADLAEPASAPASSVDDTLEKLNKQLAASQAAVQKTKEKLAAAQADPEQADKIPALEAALEKVTSKLKSIAMELAAAKKAAAASTTTTGDSDKGDPNSPERLRKKWETAQLRLQTAEQRLAEAMEQQLDTVSALQTGVEKQRERVNDALAAYQASQTETQSDVANSPDNHELEKKILAQQDRVAKAEERLTMARESGLDTVDALAMGLQKQRDKLAQLEQQRVASSTPEGV